MVTTERTPDLVPVPPDWLRRKEQQSPANANRNINDIYWRKPDGWIIVGPSAVQGSDGRPLTRQAESLIRKGWEPLIEYSYTNRVSPKTGHRETIEVNDDRLNTPDRYYWLFANGGAHLFTIDQIVEHHWHISPPFGLSLSVFPQLDEYEVPEPYWCPACPGDRPNKNSPEQVVQHMMIDHRMTLPQVRDLQEQTHGFVDKPVSRTGLNIRRKAKQTEKAAAKRDKQPAPLPEPKLLICNACGEQIEGKLADHHCEVTQEDE